jgi:isoleucyl-tRNA synthetase
MTFDDLDPMSIDAWVLAEFDELTRDVEAAFDAFDFNAAHKSLFNFCNSVLSAKYFVGVKDRLYCDRADSPRRRRTQQTLWALTDGLSRLLAPLLPHTSDEAYRALWRCAPNDNLVSVHLAPFVSRPSTRDGVGFRVAYNVWDIHMSVKWKKLDGILRQAQLAIEQAKAQGIENPLDAGVVLPNAEGVCDGFDLVDLADMLGVSRVSLDNAAKEPRVQNLRSEPRCERSWKRDGTVKQRSDGGLLSDRDALAVGV